MSFVSLQCLRGIAALGVVLFHLLPFETKYLPGAPVISASFAVGRAGVDLFFVLSGFLSVWTTRSLAGGPEQAGRFLFRRLTRVYPVYWVYCLALLGLGGAVGMASDTGFSHVVAALLLVPSAGPPLLLVSWTLVFEVYFYLVFAALIWAGGQRWMGLVLWGAMVFALHTLVQPGRTDVVADALLSPLVFEFLAGCGAAAICIWPLGPGKSAALGVAGCVVLVAALIWCDALYARPWLRVAGFGLGAALLLVGCEGQEARLRRLLPGWCVRIGDASYSLYLSHLFTLGIAGRLLQRLAPQVPLLATPIAHVAGLIGCVGAALVVAELSYRGIEQPLQRLSRGWPRRWADVAVGSTS